MVERESVTFLGSLGHPRAPPALHRDDSILYKSAVHCGKDRDSPTVWSCGHYEIEPRQPSDAKGGWSTRLTHNDADGCEGACRQLLLKASDGCGNLPVCIRPLWQPNWEQRPTGYEPVAPYIWLGSPAKCEHCASVCTFPGDMLVRCPRGWFAGHENLEEISDRGSPAPDVEDI